MQAFAARTRRPRSRFALRSRLVPSPTAQRAIRRLPHAVGVAEARHRTGESLLAGHQHLRQREGEIPPAGRRTHVAHCTSVSPHMPTAFVAHLAPLRVESAGTHVEASVAELAGSLSVLASRCERPLVVSLASNDVRLDEEGRRRNVLGGRHALHVARVERDGVLGGVLQTLPLQREGHLSRHLV